MMPLTFQVNYIFIPTVLHFCYLLLRNNMWTKYFVSELYEEVHAATIRNSKSTVIYSSWKMEFQRRNPRLGEYLPSLVRGHFFCLFWLITDHYVGPLKLCVFVWDSSTNNCPATRDSYNQKRLFSSKTNRNGFGKVKIRNGD